MQIRDGDFNIQQDISENNIVFKFPDGAGYTKDKENDAGFGSNGWPSTSGNSSGNLQIKLGRWLDMGGTSIVNLWTLPNTSPWNQMNGTSGVMQDGRRKIAMNLESTYRYFLRRNAQDNLEMEDYHIRQKKSRHYSRSNSQINSEVGNDGEIAFYEENGKGTFVSQENGRIRCVKSPTFVEYSARYAYGTDTGTNYWIRTSTANGGINLTPHNGSSTTTGTLEFSKQGSGSGSNAGTVSWENVNFVHPGSGCFEKVALNGSNFLHSRNMSLKSGWIIGLVIMEGGNSTTFTSYQNSTAGTRALFHLISFGIVIMQLWHQIYYIEL